MEVAAEDGRRRRPTSSEEPDDEAPQSEATKAGCSSLWRKVRPARTKARGGAAAEAAGGRRRVAKKETGLAALAEPGAEQPELPPLYPGPTPANPFGGQAFDILFFDLIDNADEPIHPTGATGGTSQPEPEPTAPASARADHGRARAGCRAGARADRRRAGAGRRAGARRAGSCRRAAGPRLLDEPEEPAPEPANDTASELQPIIVGAEAEPAGDKKRGWWRR